MIRSMTGVGRAESLLAGKKTKVVVEVRSANHKYLEVNMKLPNVLSGYENQIKELISSKINRGSIQLSITIQGANDELNQSRLKFNRTLSLDYELLANLIDLAKQLKRRYKLSGDLDVNTVLTYPGMIVAVRADEQEKQKNIWLRTKQAINKALDVLNNMKKEEGAFLYQDFMRRIQRISQLLKNIEVRSNTLRRQVQEKALVNYVNPSEHNSEASNNQELLGASRATAEEVVRLNSHISSFLRTISGRATKSVGRRLEFILAEMLREIETILAKGRDTQISRDGIQIKEEIDALREQVRNVE
ncbi:MAG: YicC/YloC family endoribonuclease [candidate division WOR-3 bacterium]